MKLRVAWMTMALCCAYTLAATAGSPFNHLGRFLGWGWSDGYHVPSNTGYPYPYPDYSYPAVHHDESGMAAGAMFGATESPPYSPAFFGAGYPANARWTPPPPMYRLPPTGQFRPDYPSVSVP